jgi:hypothetical protein
MDYMMVTRCPHCGLQAQVPPGLSTYLCTYCHRSFDAGAPGPRPVVVVHHTSGWSMYWTIRLGIFALVALVSLAGWIYHRATGKRVAGITDDDDDDWNGSAPLVCAGNDEITASDIKATFTSGSAINASGNCKVTCKSCVIRAPQGIQASGNAQVVLVGGSVEGETSISASANAKVDVRGDAKVVGSVAKSGNATITGVASPPAASSAPQAAASSAHVGAAASPPSHSASAKPSGKKK